MISKRGFRVLVLMAVLLAACGGATQTTAPIQAGKAPDAAATRQPGCTVVTRKPTAGPTEQSHLPPPGEKDWIKGPADAYVTITEYSDFQ